jgi:DNA-binding NtrC family response regulator
MTPQSADPSRSRGREPSGRLVVTRPSDPAVADSLIIGHSAAAAWLRGEAAFCARVPCHVVVRGETGSGKGVFVEEVRRLSPPERPFLYIPASNLVAALSASQLLGHQRGSFSGADSAAPGFAELAAGGVIVLDDADDLPEDVQQRLLGIAEGKEFWSLGGRRPIRVRLRLIVLLHHAPADLVRRGRMRADLAYRLASGLDVEVLPLRQRREDIPSLAAVLLARCSTELGCDTPSLDPTLLDVLGRREWEGNVRELESVLRRALLGALRAGAIPETLRADALVTRVPGVAPQPRAKRFSLTREAITDAFALHGSAAKAARFLGVGARTLWRRMRELGMEQPQN